MDSLMAYLAYLRQAFESGLPPDGRRWDTPCPHFRNAARELLHRGWARRRWLLFGKLGITLAGRQALNEKRVLEIEANVVAARERVERIEAETARLTMRRVL
jgi:hypothetical protein